MTLHDINWFYAGPLILLCLAIWMKRSGIWIVAVLSVLFSVWMQTPYQPSISSNRPSQAVVYGNGVWLLPEAQRKMVDLNAMVSEKGIAYSENNYVKNCQQKTGVQLLAFPKIKAVWTYRETGWCTEMAATVRAVYSVDSNNTSITCQKAFEEAFENPKGFTPCVIGANKDYSKQGWKILLNCSQRDQEYQLRWFIPNMLTGGASLDSFAGINFDKGQCLDASHEGVVGILLDVIGLGRGIARYDKR
jgi:hypothetical protein